VELNASGSGYTLTLTGVPVYSCRRCRTSLMIDEFGELGLDSIVVATVNALETLGPEAQGEPRYLSFHCRSCRATLPKVDDPVRSHFRSNAVLGTTGKLIGVDFYGAAFSCPRCHTTHPHLPSPLYHKIKDAVTRAARFYQRQ
jgi:hypothetical protein